MTWLGDTTWYRFEKTPQKYTKKHCFMKTKWKMFPISGPQAKVTKGQRTITNHNISLCAHRAHDWCDKIFKHSMSMHCKSSRHGRKSISMNDTQSVFLAEIWYYWSINKLFRGAVGFFFFVNDEKIVIKHSFWKCK